MSRDTGHMCWGGEQLKPKETMVLTNHSLNTLLLQMPPQATIFNYVNTFISQYLGRDSHKRTHANLNFVTFTVFNTFTLPPFPFFGGYVNYNFLAHLWHHSNSNHQCQIFFFFFLKLLEDQSIVSFTTALAW